MTPGSCGRRAGRAGAMPSPARRSASPSPTSSSPSKGRSRSSTACSPTAAAPAPRAAPRASSGVASTRRSREALKGLSLRGPRGGRGAAMKPIYFDHAATTPVDPRVLEAMLPFFGERYGNPSELHALGREGRRAVEAARAAVAAALDAGEREIVFTSGGTEADNLALSRVPGALRARPPHRQRHRARRRHGDGQGTQAVAAGPWTSCPSIATGSSTSTRTRLPSVPTRGSPR